MRILIVTTRFGEGLGGKENYLLCLSRGLAARGHQVRVLTRAGDAFPEFSDERRFSAWRSALDRPSPAGVEVKLVRPRPGSAILGRLAYRLHFYRRTFGLAVRALGAVLGAPVDEEVRWAEIVQYDGTGLELLGDVTAGACRRHGRPLVVCPHAHPGSWGDSPSDLALYRRADGVIAKTGYEKEFFVAHEVGRDRIEVIGNGAYLPEAGDPEALASRLGHRGPWILFVGRRHAVKGYPALLEAMPKVWARVPDGHLLVLSPRDDLAAGPWRDPRIHELPGASEQDKDAAYGLATVMCLPSRAEAFGMAVVEAWTHRVPVVVGRIPSLAEVVDEGHDGLLVEQDPDEIAVALTTLLEKRQHRERMGRAGYAKVQASFTWDHIVGLTVALYQSCLTRAATPPGKLPRVSRAS